METAQARNVTEAKTEKRILEDKSQPNALAFKRINDLTLLDKFIREQPVDLDRLEHLFLRPREISHRSHRFIQKEIVSRFKDRIKDTEKFVDNASIRELIVLALYMYGFQKKKEKETAIKIISTLIKDIKRLEPSDANLVLYFAGRIYCYEHPSKLTPAKDYFQKVTHLGIVEANTQLGLIALRENNIDAAKTFFEKASIQGSNRAKFELGRLYDKLNIFSEKINELYLTAIQNGNYIAAAALGERYQAANHPDSILLFRKACEDAHPNAIAAINQFIEQTDSPEVLYHCAVALSGFDYDKCGAAGFFIQKKLDEYFRPATLTFARLFVECGDSWKDLTLINECFQYAMVPHIRDFALIDKMPGAARSIRLFVERELAEAAATKKELDAQQEEFYPGYKTIKEEQIKATIDHCTSILQRENPGTAPEFIYHRALAVRNFPGPLQDTMLASLELLIKEQPRVVFEIFQQSGDTWEMLSPLLQHSKHAAEIQAVLLQTSAPNTLKVVTPSSLYAQVKTPEPSSSSSHQDTEKNRSGYYCRML